jgi:hypothetical protein
MSTKITLSHHIDEATGVEAHLSEDSLGPDGFPVTLELTGISEVSLELTDQGNRVSVVIPRSVAKKLGLLADESTAKFAEEQP